MNPDNTKAQLVPIGTVVERLQRDYPDISHSSLRFLEREGLIVPTRTPGGHRLYAPADIQRVRQIKDWQAQRLSLQEIRERLALLASVGTPGDLAGTFLDQALAGDLAGARETILKASDVGLPLSILFYEVLQPALWELGERWARHEISVAQEKEVSETARELIAELTIRHAGNRDDAAPVIVAACVSGEEHELGLRMLSGLLREQNINVHYLGAAVDSRFLVEAVQLRRPRIVLLSATLDEHLIAIQNAAAALREIDDIPTQIIAGGQAVKNQPDLVASWGVEPIGDGVSMLIDSILARRDSAGSGSSPEASES